MAAGNQESNPNPVPSAVTSEAIDRAVLSAESRINARLDGMEKAVEVFHADLTRVPTLLDRSITGLRELMEQIVFTEIEKLKGQLDTNRAETAEKFAGVGAQFSERDTRTDQRAGDTKLAVDAAFAAAKEATAKIEAGFTKQIDGMVTIIDTKTSNLDGRISDVKDMVTNMTGRSKGLDAGWGYLVGGAGFVAILYEILARTSH
jgi:hypothetical protein